MSIEPDDFQFPLFDVDSEKEPSDTGRRTLGQTLVQTLHATRDARQRDRCEVLHLRGSLASGEHPPDGQTETNFDQLVLN